MGSEIILKQKYRYLLYMLVKKIPDFFLFNKNAYFLVLYCGSAAEKLICFHAEHITKDSNRLYFLYSTI
jgi:hypothetical protein